MEFQISPLFLGLIPLTMAIVSIVKIYVDAYWSPLVALATALLLCIIVTDLSVVQTIVPALIVGASAAGFYSGVKTMVS